MKILKAIMKNVKVMFDCTHGFYRGDMVTDYIEKMGSIWPMCIYLI